MRKILLSLLAAMLLLGLAGATYTTMMDDMLGAGTVIVGPLESARFLNSTGYINVGSYMVTGKMTVLKVT
jgi:hypothetical protein